MKESEFVYRDGAQECVGFLVSDVAARRPGVIIIPDAGGIGEHIKESARRIAAQGYVALCADMFGAGRKPATQDEVAALVAPFFADAAAMRRRARAGLDALRVMPFVDADRVAAIGYCFGGKAVLEMARDSAPVKGVVSFHGVLSTNAPAAPGAVKAKVLVFNGADDPYAPEDDVAGFQAEMKAAKANWQFVNFGGVQHAFTLKRPKAEPMPGIAYDEAADRRSWAGMSHFLEEIFV